MGGCAFFATLPAVATRSMDTDKALTCVITATCGGATAGAILGLSASKVVGYVYQKFQELE